MSLGFFSPDSITWKIHSDPSMFVGGIRALLEQALHPEAMAGVAAHSNFREDSWGRLERTGDYVATLTFASKEKAEKLAARVRGVHTKLKLDDQRLLLWVHMAMVDAFLDTALRAGLVLSDREQDRYLEEMVIFARLVGIDEARVPRSVAELRDYFKDIQSELYASDDAKRAALFIALPPLPPLLRFGTPIAPLWGSVTSIAGSSLPKWAKSLYGWPTLPGQEGATNMALKALRSALLLVPESLRQTPEMKFAFAQAVSEK